MSIITIILFFIYTWGFGFSVTFFLKNSDNFLERNLMRIGTGLGVFSVVTIFLNLLHIPLDWKIVLVLSIVVSIAILLKSLLNKERQKINIKLTKSDVYILIVLLIFFIHLSIYLKGAFLYPYLEDDDSWDHAKSAEYVAIEKTAFEPEEYKALPGHGMFHYLDPYPPTYPILMGILHQTSSSLNWTLKFFNSLIISLGILFFYFFVKEFTNSQAKALFATFILAIIPSYFSHFIWSLSLSVALFFPALYCLEKLKEDKKWAIPSIFIIASIFLTQVTTSVHFGIFLFFYILVKIISSKKIEITMLVAPLVSILISILIWWGPMLFKYGNLSKLLAGLGTNVPGILFREANRFYVWNDFIFVKNSNMINNPVGIGFFLSILLIASFLGIYLLYAKHHKIEIYLILPILGILIIVSFIFQKINKFLLIEELKKSALPYSEAFFAVFILLLAIYGVYLIWLKKLPTENAWIAVALFWLFYTFLNVFGSRLFIRLDYHRTWLIMAIPIAILVTEGLWFILSLNLQLKIATLIILPIFYLIYVSKAHAYNVLEGAQYYIPAASILLEYFLIISVVISIIFYLLRQQKLYLKDAIKAILLSEIILFLSITSAYQKYEVNTAVWPPGVLWSSTEELKGYVSLLSMPPNTKVFPFCINSERKLIGFDKTTYPWKNEGASEYYSYNFTKANEFYSLLKNKNYEYAVIDGGCTQDKNIGINKTNEIIQDLINSTKFQPAQQTQGMILFRIL